MRLTYDLAGRKTSMTDPDMGYWRYYYDALGNLTSQTDARTCTTSLTYDGLNRLTGKNYTGTCSTTPAVSYTYDEYNVELDIDNNGYRTGMNDASGGTTWTYDIHGRVESETRNITGSGTFKTNWTYNSADQVVTMLYPSNNTSGQSETVTYTYLPQMVLDTAIGTSTYVSNTLYDAAGRVTTRALSSSSFRQVYSYVPWASVGGGSLDVLKAGTNADSYNNLMNLNYEYSVTGNIQSIVDGTNSNQVQCYEYDVLNRLTKGATNTGQTDCSFAAVGNGSYDERYAYDVSTGNLQSKTVRNIINSTYTASTYGYQDTAHVHGVTHLNGTQKYWYDANGNQIKRIVGTYTYDLTYDAENRLIEVKRNGTSFATFVYNGDGERVKSTLGSTTTTFVGNYYEWTGSATTMKKYYYAGSQRVAVRTGSSTLNFLLGDHLGSTSLTTSGTGAYQSETLYKPWGEVRYTSGTLSTQYTFTGQYSNVSDFGLMYYGARFYDPLLGRFSSADTIIPGAGNPQSWDRYSYTLNNPVKYTDPSGHWMCDIYDPGCAENPVEKVEYLLGTFQLRNPAQIKNWEEIKDDPADLLARVILSEEGNKLFTDKWRDAEGIVWVIRNRHDKWYREGIYPYSRVTSDNWWLEASTEGVFGMEQDGLIGFSVNVQVYYGHYGDSVEEAVFAYNIAYEIALDVLAADTSQDPTRGATAYADAYVNENGEEVPYERTHFWLFENGYSTSWCLPNVICK